MGRTRKPPMEPRAVSLFLRLSGADTAAFLRTIARERVRSHYAISHASMLRRALKEFIERQETSDNGENGKVSDANRNH